ncbi:MAG: glycine zipper family protein [Candidatus Reddybacter sp.]
MSGNNSVLVPLESWAYASPELIGSGINIDIGLFAESLIYYDTVIVNPSNQPQLAEFINWFIRQGSLNDFYMLLNEDVLKIYDYSFMSTAIEKNGSFSLWNIQDPIQAEKNTFERRFLYHKSIEELFPKARHRKHLYSAFKDNVIEVKSEEFSPAIENARADFQDPIRNSLIVQAFVDEIYRVNSLGRPPEIKATIVNSPDGTKHRITFNTDFEELNRLAGTGVNFINSTPLTASAHSNRLIWSAATMGSDIFLPQPMSSLVGDKLYESKERITKSGDIIEELKEKVEFPDIRGLVNSNKLTLREILKIREKSKRFRAWLQQENGRDRDAIIAYHNEVAKEIGIVTGARKALSIFGIIGGGATGSAVGATIAGPVGAAIGGATGSTIGYLADVSSKVGKDWKPVVFGGWLKERIEKVVADNE